jgi:GDPmannose 4,6-dehydratase
MKIAIVTGLAGELGSYLSDILLERGYIIHALVRPESLPKDTTDGQIHWHAAALGSYAGLARLVKRIAPDEFYHLEEVDASADEGVPLQEHIGSTHTILQVLRDILPRCRFVLRATHELFGQTDEATLGEEAKFYPCSTEGIAHVAAFELTRHFRRDHGLHASVAILFPHASPRSVADHPLRRISAEVARIKLGIEGRVRVDDLCRRVDWSHTADCAHALWLMAQAETGDDFVLATGQTNTIRETLHMAFSCVGLSFWPHVQLDRNEAEIAATTLLMGDAAKANRRLGWARSRRFKEIVVEMVRQDMEKLAGRPLELQAWRRAKDSERIRETETDTVVELVPVERRRRA